MSDNPLAASPSTKLTARQTPERKVNGNMLAARDGDTSFTLIRHGATALNSTGSGDRIRGWSNVPLSKEGHEEAHELGKKLARSGLKVIVTSDLDRAKHTAEAVAKTTGADLITTRKLRPWDLGNYTGQHSTDVIKEMPQYLDDPKKKVPGGEAFCHFRDRAFDGIREAVEKAKGRPFAVVTHHRVERLLKAWMAEGQPSDGSFDLKTFLQRGEPPGNTEKISIKPARL